MNRREFLSLPLITVPPWIRTPRVAVFGYLTASPVTLREHLDTILRGYYDIPDDTMTCRAGYYKEYVERNVVRYHSFLVFYPLEIRDRHKVVKFLPHLPLIYKRIVY